jgi:hypothetical protein
MGRLRFGSVLVNGSTRQITTDGNPLGRIVVQVDGVTVYDKWQLTQWKTFRFELVPGKPAYLRWLKLSDETVYEVIVDGQTTRLSTASETPEENHGRKNRERWIGFGACFGVVALLFGINYQSRMEDGSYYPGYLGLVPLFLIAGVCSLFFPDWKSKQNSKVGQVILGAVAVAIMAFGYTYFTHWFLQTFKYIPPNLANDY